MKHVYGVYVWERGQVSPIMSLWTEPEVAMTEAEVLSSSTPGTRAYVVRLTVDEANTRRLYVEYVGGKIRKDNRVQLISTATKK